MLCLAVGSLLFVTDLMSQASRDVDVSFYSSALRLNRSGESAMRHVSVYLPPSYRGSSTRRYPTVYLLHGFQGSYRQWSPIFGILDSLIKTKAIREIIVVMPDGNNKYGGSFYTNSPTTGNWEDFIVGDLVSYVDSHYRTMRRASSRGLAGHSMGGYAALKLGMKHPNVFGAVYAMSPCCLGWAGDLSPENPAWDTTRRFRSFDDLKPRDEIYFAQALMGLSAAWSPSPTPPLYADLLVQKAGTGTVVSESTRAKWSANMPLAMVDQYRSNLSQLRGIAFDVGSQDEFTHIPITSRAFSQSLKETGIRHVFEEYQGDHNNRIPERLVQHLLPFFSNALEFPLIQ
jgi:S-formylglutathione hydrolase